MGNDISSEEHFQNLKAMRGISYNRAASNIGDKAELEFLKSLWGLGTEEE
jgi:hypothetical protein